MQEPQSLCLKCVGQKGNSRHVAAGTCHAGNEAGLDGVETAGEDDRDCCGCRLGRLGRNTAATCNDDRHLTAHQISRQRWQSIVMPLRPAVFDRDVATLDKARLVEALVERGHDEV